MTDILDEHVAERAAYFRKKHAEAMAVAQALRADIREGGTATINRDQLDDLTGPLGVFFELAYGLDEAMKALKFYANENTWTEVPAKTFAADDRGLQARVALSRINPV